MKKTNNKFLGALAIFSTLSMQAMAGGFQLFEENVTNLGNAYAGTSAQADDASTEFFNPAGMTRLDNGQVQLSGTYIDLDSNVNIKSATTTITVGTLPPFVNSVSGTTEARPAVPATIPAFHFVYPFDHKWALGFGVTAPFGLETNYPSDSMARFMATESKVQVINLGPSVAYQFNPHFSLGVGVDSQYMSATFNQAVQDFQGDTAGNFINEGDNWAWGWHAGALYQFNPCTRLGLNYHSRVRHTLHGDALLDIEQFDLPPDLTVADRIPGKFTANVTLPDYADLSLFHQFNPNWAFLSSVEFTHWSMIKNIVAHYSGDLADNDAFELPTADLPFDFRDTWRLAAGLNFMPTEKWTLRTGIAYDQSPVRNDSTRTFRLPDSDRYWIALGAQYIVNRAFTIDAGYSHLFVSRSSLNNTQQFSGIVFPNIPLLRTNVLLSDSGIADFDSSVNELGVQVTWNIPDTYS